MNDRNVFIQNWNLIISIVKNLVLKFLNNLIIKVQFY
jgi:hypothetical protein